MYILDGSDDTAFNESIGKWIKVKTNEPDVVTPPREITNGVMTDGFDDMVMQRFGVDTAGGEASTINIVIVNRLMGDIDFS